MKGTYILIVLFLIVALQSCGVYYQPRGRAYYPRRNFATIHYAPMQHFGGAHYGGGHYGGGHYGGGHYGGGHHGGGIR